MATVNTTLNTPWTQYYCNANNPCTVPNTECHHNKYCIPILAPGEKCKDEKDPTDPFIARVGKVYTYFCDMPDYLVPQNTTCPLGCEKWENCHANICFVKECTKDQTECKNGNVQMCNGLDVSEIFCYSPEPHASVKTTVEDSGLSSAQIGGIAGGVSAAVLIAAALGAIFFVRRRRANRAKAQAHASNESLPTYSAPNGDFGSSNEKQMQQVSSA